jgi:hypothetical protein
MKLTFKDSMLLVDATYSLKVPQRTDSLYFLLGPQYTLHNIKAEGLRSYALAQKADRPFPFYLLKFDQPLSEGLPLNIQFNYEIDLKKDNHLNSDWIELNADKMWFPNFNDLNNEFAYEVTIRNFPPDFTPIGHSSALLTTHETGIHIKKTTPWAEVLLLAGKDMKTWQLEENLKVIARATTADSIVTSIGTKVKHSIAYLNEAFGSTDPITEFTVVLRNTTSKELGFQFSRQNMIVTGVDFNDYADLSHEVAHYWWMGANFIDEPWLNESFANYSMYLVLEAFEPSEFQKLVRRNNWRSQQAIPVKDATLFTPDAYDSYYNKGSIILKKLEQRIGRELMNTFLQRRVEKKINTTQGVLEELEALTDSETRAFFESLLRS